MELKIYRVNRQRFINCWELYQALELDKKNYYRWLITTLTENKSLDNGTDYFPYESNAELKKGRPATQFLITPGLGKAICINKGTILSKKVRNIIERDFEKRRANV